MNTGSDTPVFQVSEFIEAINQHLRRLGEVTLEGELSRLDIKNGRLIFATIKDAASSVDVFSLTNMIRNLKELEPGMLIHVSGTAGLYKGSGKFRLFASRMIPHGEGALQIAYEKLKAQLMAEGLFAPERKRPLPLWPKHIGLITSPGSSAQADLLKILSTRMGNLHLMTLPVNVQGREAIPSISQAFAYIKAHSTAFDLVIMARGGGSLEDLAAFNSEEICRLVYACPVPVISAIGHEDDWSLTDFVADLRASTPSNAAELAVRDHREVWLGISEQLQTFHQRLLRQLNSMTALIDQINSRLHRQMTNLSASVTQAIHRVPVMSQSLKSMIREYRQLVIQTLPILKTRLMAELNLKRQALVNADRLLVSLDYREVLKRGYSLTTAEDGRLLHSIDQTGPGRSIYTQLGDGRLKSTIINQERKTYA